MSEPIPPGREVGPAPSTVAAVPTALPATKPRVSRRFAGLVVVLAAVGFAAIGFAVWYFFIRTPEPKDDFGRFQGHWQLSVPDGKDSASGRATPVTIRVTGDRWVWMVGDQEQKRYTMELRPDTDPKEIDLVLLAADDSPVIQKWPGQPRKVMLRGIYVVERDSAKLVVRPGDEPRPTSLDADEGVAVWILEKK
jgi:uncharacterized protein (TIGR03067 family)